MSNMLPTYDHREGGIVVIYKKKSDLTSYEKLLVKYQPERYIRKDPKKANKKKKGKKSRSEKRRDKELKAIWKDYDDMQKNPKKFKKKEKRHEELLQRYMKSKKKKDKKSSKKEKLQRKSVIAYLDARNKEIELDKMGLNTNHNMWIDPSRQFATSFFSPSAAVHSAQDSKMSKLKMLEEEILNNVQGDLFEDHLIHQYYGGGSKQFKKDRKRHQKQLKKAQKRRKKVREVVVDASYVKNILG